MFFLSHSPIDPAALRRSLQNPQAGGFVSFEGWVRNHNEGQIVTALAYQAYEALACNEAQVIFEETRQNFAIIDICAAHRIGQLQIGDLAVWVGIAAAHREAAFLACRYVIDEIKLRLPIWKKETYQNGQTAWVNCHRCGTHR